jgi:hypothetical protein
MEWLFHLPVVWMTVVVAGAFGAVSGLIYAFVMKLASGGRLSAFKAMSPVMLTPLAVVFGLIIGFLAAQVWGDAHLAHAVVVREAGALRTTVLLSKAFPGEDKQIEALVRRHIQEAVNQEWPEMARHEGTLPPVTDTDTEALQLVLALSAQHEPQRVAQREMMTALRSVIDARNERVIISKARIDWVKWTVVLVLAVLILVAIAMIHSDNRTTAKVALALFALAAAFSVVLIASHNRPFTGEISVSPDLLLQVMPKE